MQTPTPWLAPMSAQSCTRGCCGAEGCPIPSISWMTHRRQSWLFPGKPEGERHLLGEAWMIKTGIDSKADSYRDMAWLCVAKD